MKIAENICYVFKVYFVCSLTFLKHVIVCDFITFGTLEVFVDMQLNVPAVNRLCSVLSSSCRSCCTVVDSVFTDLIQDIMISQIRQLNQVMRLHFAIKTYDIYQRMI